MGYWLGSFYGADVPSVQAFFDNSREKRLPCHNGQYVNTLSLWCVITIDSNVFSYAAYCQMVKNRHVFLTMDWETNRPSSCGRESIDRCDWKSDDKSTAQNAHQQMCITWSAARCRQYTNCSANSLGITLWLSGKRLLSRL